MVRISVLSLLFFEAVVLNKPIIEGTCMAGAVVGEPPSTPYSVGYVVIVTALHWLKCGGRLRLVASYRNHGIV